MEKRLLTAAVTFTLFLSVFVAVDTVKAQYGTSSIAVTYGSTSTFVGQRVEFTLNYTDGAPPYTYHWYTQLWPTWRAGMPLHLDPVGAWVEWPNASSNVFEFIPPINGTYCVYAKVTDAQNITHAAGNLPPGIWVYASPITVGAHASSPELSLFNPQNITYETGKVPLDIAVSEPTASIQYSLDNAENVTVNGNTTLTKLPNGNHTVAVYVENLVGLYSSKETAFIVNAITPDITSQPEAPETSWLWVAALVAVLLAVGLTLYIIQRRRHRGLSFFEA